MAHIWKTAAYTLLGLAIATFGVFYHMMFRHYGDGLVQAIIVTGGALMVGKGLGELTHPKQR